MQIFVGGTGRSGTSQIAQVIGDHPAVWHIPPETRFLTDPGGLSDVVRALSSEYTSFRGFDALDRFRVLLTRDVAGRAPAEAVAHVDLTEVFGTAEYAAWTRRFLSELTWYSFTEFETERIVGRYFADRAELLALCRSYVDELFSSGAGSKPYWCEKTPNNMLAGEFLWELFPEARLLHIVRHPVQVAASHLSMQWAPDDVHRVCNWLEPMYRRWLSADTSADPRCLQVRLEDLAVDWPTQRARLFDWLGLPDAETERQISPDRLAHWAPLSATDESYVRQRLAFAIDAFDYR